MPISPLAEIVLAASRRPEVRASAAALYEEVGRRVAERRPLCVVSGRCCRFEEFGHRLFVTSIELATFYHELDQLAGLDPRPTNPGGCPFQRGRLCGVHAIRPFGCRIFFCDASAGEWQSAEYERFHGQLKRLHESLDVPYRYVEWRAALAELGLTT